MSGSATSGTGMAATSDGPGASESDGAETTTSDCTDVHVGDLVILDDDDVSAASTIRVVQGFVSVFHSSQEDLSFLSCLAEIEGDLNIRDNTQLRSLRGLENLAKVRNVSITGNPLLTSAAGLESLESLDHHQNAGFPTGVLTIVDNDALEDLGFNSLRSLFRLDLGYCGVDESELPPGFTPPALKEINGLTNLEHLGVFRVSEQYGLVSLGRLHELAATGAIQTSDVMFNNHQLPYSEVVALREALGQEVFACGNNGDNDDPEPICSQSPMFGGDCVAPPP